MPPHPVPQRGVLTARLIPTHIVYAPPGKSSSMAYSNGLAVGTTITLTDDHTNSIKVTASVGYKIPLVSEANLDVGVGYSWGTTRTDGLDLTVSRTSGYRKPGSIDGIDHDDDEVWFFVAPKFSITATAASYYGPTEVTWTFDPTQRIVPYFLYVGELRGTRPIPQDVQDNLRRWGFGAKDLQSLLSIHPFPNGTEPGEPMDPVRFDYLTTLVYRPSRGAAGVQNFELARKEVNSSTVEAKNIFSADVSLTASAGFLEIFSLKVKIDQGLKITTSSSTKNALTNETKSTLAISLPPSGYNGPTVLRVYQDKIFKTFVFALDWF